MDVKLSSIGEKVYYNLDNGYVTTVDEIRRTTDGLYYITCIRDVRDPLYQHDVAESFNVDLLYLVGDGPHDDLDMEASIYAHDIAYKGEMDNYTAYMETLEGGEESLMKEPVDNSMDGDTNIIEAFKAGARWYKSATYPYPEWTEDEKKSFKRRMDRIIDTLDWAEEKGEISYSNYIDYVSILKSLRPDISLRNIRNKNNVAFTKLIECLVKDIQVNESYGDKKMPVSYFVEKYKDKFAALPKKED